MYNNKIEIEFYRIDNFNRMGMSMEWNCKFIGNGKWELGSGKKDGRKKVQNEKCSSSTAFFPLGAKKNRRRRRRNKCRKDLLKLEM
jgi:hypothetical protein